MKLGVYASAAEERRRRFVLSSLLLFLLLSLGSCAHSKTRLELAETYYTLGNAYSELERWNEAGDAYIRAIELDPSLRRAGFQMARVYVQAGEYSEAEEILLELYGKETEVQEVEEYLAWLYIRSGRSQEAREIYREILADNPADCDVRYNLALLASKGQEWERCRELLAACLDYGEMDAEMNRLLGLSMLELEQEGALGFLERAYEQRKELPGLRRELARAYRITERYGKAVEIYDELLQNASDKETGELHFQKAYIYLTAIEDYERGVESLDKALKAGYRDSEALEKLMNYPDLLDPQRIEEVFRRYDIESLESDTES